MNDLRQREVHERRLRDAVLSGDAQAWQTLYDAAFDPLYAYVHWRCAGLRDLADDVVQETWLTAVRRLRHFRPADGPFLAWLRGIAANLVRNQLRRHARRDRLAPARNGTAHAPPAEHRLEQRDRAEQVARALAVLSARHEAVLRARYLDGRSVADIAAEWNESPKAIESLLTRAREAFRLAHGQPE